MAYRHVNIKKLDLSPQGMFKIRLKILIIIHYLKYFKSSWDSLGICYSRAQQVVENDWCRAFWLVENTFSVGEKLSGTRPSLSASSNQFLRASSSHSVCILSQNSVSDCRRQFNSPLGHSQYWIIIKRDPVEHYWEMLFGIYLIMV